MCDAPLCTTSTKARPDTPRPEHAEALPWSSGSGHGADASLADAKGDLLRHGWGDRDVIAAGQQDRQGVAPGRHVVEGDPGGRGVDDPGFPIGTGTRVPMYGAASSSRKRCRWQSSSLVALAAAQMRT